MAGRQQQQDATLTVNGRSFGNWAGLTGGDVDSEETIFYPGGMRPARSLGGQASTDNVTLQKLLDDLTDDDVRFLLDAVGKPLPAVATRLLLDASDRATRRPWTYRGTVKTVATDEFASDSSDPLLIHVTLTVTGKPTVA